MPRKMIDADAALALVKTDSELYRLYGEAADVIKRHPACDVEMHIALGRIACAIYRKPPSAHLPRHRGARAVNLVVEALGIGPPLMYRAKFIVSCLSDDVLDRIVTTKGVSGEKISMQQLLRICHVPSTAIAAFVEWVLSQAPTERQLALRVKRAIRASWTARYSRILMGHPRDR
jgi:hypothetical protein